MSFPRSGTVDTQTFSGTKDFIFARMSALQNANIGSADHLKFDTIDFSRPLVAQTPGSSGAVSLDTSTAYANTLGAPSIGRFSVKGGKLYKLKCDPRYALYSGAIGLVALQWVDVTVLGAQVVLGTPMQFSPVSSAVNEYNAGGLETFYNPGGGQNDLFLLEVQIIGAPTALTQIGSATKGLATALVETF
jgi:hypothetical protein